MLKSVLSRMESFFPSVTLIEGQGYQLSGQVLRAQLSEGLLKARVKGGASGIFTVFADLRSWPEIPSRCNCAKAANCKHVVAAIYELISTNGMPVSAHVEQNQKTESITHETVLRADDHEWYSDAIEGGYGLFSYQLGIIIDGEQVSIVPLIVDLIGRLDNMNLDRLPDNNIVKLSLPDNRVLHIELGRIKPLLRLMLHYGIAHESKGVALDVNSYQLLLIEDAERAMSASAARWHNAVALQDKLKQLIDVPALPQISPPVKLQTSLRDYQQHGLNWLQFLRQNHFGGVLADDMGLGKTVQTLAHLQHEKAEGRLNRACLILAPTTLVVNWYDESQRFTPELKVCVFHGQDRHQISFSDYDIVISTYGLLQRDKARFLDYGFYYLILDEAQMVKNARTKTSQMIHQLQGEHRLCLTGTPLENHLGELWSLFHFLMPGFLGDGRRFRQFFRIPIEKNGDDERRELLMGRIRPFLLRRTKANVAKELPEKTEMTHLIELSGAQRDLYEAIRISMEKRVRDAIAEQGLGRSHIVFLDALLKLRQICCDPRLLAMPEAGIAHGSSAKLDALMRLLDNLMEEGRSALVFSQFTSMLKIIEEQLRARNYSYLKLTGQTQNRHDMVNRFQNGEAPIFLISLKAGGKGLNLTQADTVIHYDPWWNPAVEAQATDRSYRIGQKNPVFVYKLVVSGTVEEGILEMQAKKRELFDSVLDEQSSGKVEFTEETVMKFFKSLDSL